MAQKTPMMKQYYQIKTQHKDTVLFFRLGDFYEMFDKDAAEVSHLLNITLTKRNGIPMCGIPHHAAANYIARLLKLGKKIAICEQTKMPQKSGEIAQREVIEIKTPGTLFESNYLDEKKNNYLAAICGNQEKIALAYIDLSTAQFFVTAFPKNRAAEIISSEMQRLDPPELLLQESLFEDNPLLKKKLKQRSRCVINSYPDWKFDSDTYYQLLINHFKVKNLKGFGLTENDAEVQACGIVLEYLADTSRSLLDHIRHISLYGEKDYLVMDEATIRNLEIVRNLQEEGERFSLLGILDHTGTAMGARLLRSWLLRPLVEKAAIEKRLDAVEEFYHNQSLLSAVREMMAKVYDLQRLGSRVALEKAHARDLLAIKDSLNLMLQINQLLKEEAANIARLLPEQEEMARSVFNLIDVSISEEASSVLGEGKIIKAGFNKELDQLINLKDNSKELLDEYLESEKQSSGINNLRIKYNKIIGHYLEVSKGNLAHVPEHFIRRQSLVNTERFTTDRLIKLENKLNTALDNYVEMDRRLFLEQRAKVKEKVPELLDCAQWLAENDVYQSFARAATVQGYCRPQLHQGKTLEIIEGRHPVVENNLTLESFIPNSLYLDPDDKGFALITGPNMAGKSTFLRQTALILLMAQCGSFVPAQSASLGISDRIYCRVGASDNLARGESTFLVEMNETANILRSATDKSLIIMDEVGRGTSTHDGISIAWAVSEYLLDTIKAKTLFATHYHELIRLESPRVIQLFLDVLQEGEEIIFLKKVREGTARKSYGIHVARLAGLPAPVIKRAKDILKQLDQESPLLKEIGPPSEDAEPAGLFSEEDLLLDEIKSLDLNSLTPLDALNKMAEWKKRL